MSAALGLLAVLVLTAGTGYFVAQEFAFVAADRLTLTRQAAEGDKRAARALTVQERLSFMLSGAQLGITVTGLVVGFLAEPSLARLLDPALDAVGLPAAAAHGVAAARGRPRDWWALAWLRGTELATDILWSRSPAFSRPGARQGLWAAGAANLAMAVGFAALSRRS